MTKRTKLKHIKWILYSKKERVIYYFLPNDSKIRRATY